MLKSKSFDLKKIIFTAILGLILPAFSAKAQKILQDKIDPFTNERSIVTNNVVLASAMGKAVLQAGSSAKITDSAVNYFLSFVHEAIPTNFQTSDSIQKGCLLKMIDNITINGEWVSDGTAQIGLKLYAVYTYRFTETDFKKLLASGISHVKINDKLFQIDRKNENKLSSVCKTLANKIGK
jgi:hypothetical protein